jgi:pimeloyl-ACP methyl ester carboxylesterase
MVPPIASSPIPNHICCAPIRWICDKISALMQKIFGYIIRITNFQLGEMKVAGAYTIMRIYQRLSSDPREEKPFDAARLAESKRFLTEFGGVEAVVRPADNQAEIHCMTFKSTDFYNRFAQLGAHPIDIVHEGRPRKALLNPPPAAAKFYLPKIDIRLADGTLVKGALLPESPTFNGPRPVILHCHSPGRSMAMDRKFLGLYLAAGYDVVIWDPRGTVDSTGTPSEGGYYLDAEAVFQHTLNQGYPPNRIYISGFCKGAACATHLKRKYHHLGVHLIASNPYTSMKDVIEGHGWIGRIASRFGLKALQSTDPAISNLVQQDCFDNVAKLRNLPRSTGKCIFIHTDTDTLMPHGTVQKLIDAFDNAGPVHEILRVHPNPKANGHTQPPYEDDLVWRRVIAVAT